MLKVLFADGFSPSCFTDLSASSHFKVLKLASDGKALEPDVIDEALPEVEALVVRARTKVTEAVLEVAPHLKYLIRAGTGLDNIDCQAPATIEAWASGSLRAQLKRKPITNSATLIAFA